MSAQSVATFFLKIEKWYALYFYTYYMYVPTPKATTKIDASMKTTTPIIFFLYKKKVALKIKIEFSASHKTSGKS